MPDKPAMRSAAIPYLSPHLEAIERALQDGPTDDLPALIGELERLKTKALIRAARPPERADNGPDENLSVQEAARRLGVSVDWLYKNARRLPFTVKICRRVLFSAHGLERWNGRRQN
jgi:hypothetical protein